MADNGNFFTNLLNTPDTTAEFDQEDIRQNKVMGILAYIGILVLIPIFAAKNSKYARFHANQGLILLIADAILVAATSIITGILNMISWILGWTLGGLLSTVSGLVIAGLMVFGIVFVAKGRAKELPIIGNFRILR